MGAIPRSLKMSLSVKDVKDFDLQPTRICMDSPSIHKETVSAWPQMCVHTR